MAHKTYQYCVAENWGKGFIEHGESSKITFSSLPGNVWRVPAHNKDANLWISKVLGTVKTKDEAQAKVVQLVLTPAGNLVKAATSPGSNLLGIIKEITTRLEEGQTIEKIA